MSENAEGGRIFFARTRHVPDRDAEIRLISVGVDIGSATSHMAFSRLVLKRGRKQATLVRRELLHESQIFLTPYTDEQTIDTERLGAAIAAEYDAADINPETIDTGALILTGLAARQRNARAIGEIFAAETGRFVAVAAGDALETILSAHGSGAVAASVREACTVMNLDIGGGTAKIARCADGEITSLTAIDIGARLVLFADDGRITRIEPAGARLIAEAGLGWRLGDTPAPAELARLAGLMAQCLFEACGGEPLSPLAGQLLRLKPLADGAAPAQLSFSGGVSEYIHARESARFGDLGPALAEAVCTRFEGFGTWRFADHGIRATVIGASQFSVQLSGNTIFVDPSSVLPLPNLPVIAPAFDWDDLAAPAVCRAVLDALERLGLEDPLQPTAIAYRWEGDATHDRIAAFCAGLVEALSPQLARHVPLVLVGHGDLGGLLGAHLRRHEMARHIVSIDGITARELDFIDIGEMLIVSGGVPVVIKSLVFPEA